MDRRLITGTTPDTTGTPGDDASDEASACRACGFAPAPAWDTSDGRVHLCPPCAALHGVGCP